MSFEARSSISEPCVAQAGSRGEILVVDDNASNLLAIAAALQSLDVEIIRADSGEAALRLLLTHDFALILLDVNMPSMDGFETARLIRSRKRSSHTPIIFITAYGRNDQDVLAAYQLGAVDFLFKPVIPELLRAKAGVFVELHRRALEVARQAELIREHERREHERALEAERRQWEAESLRKQMEHLADVDRRKDHFLAVLGHELRNPLAPIVTGLELLKQKFETTPDLEPWVVRTRDAMQRQVEHVTRLVDDLLDISRINSGKIELKRIVLPAQRVVEQAIATCLPGIEAQGHELSVDVPSEPLDVSGDDVRLVQIVSNLLNNAVRYTPRNGKIRVRCVRVGPEVEISVTDNGRGISPELLPRIFEPFVQDHDSRSAGLGMGLSIVGRLVALHGGSVSAKSDGIDRGSEFVVRLPMAREPRREPSPEAPEAERIGSSLLIAVVEDNPDIREMIAALLTAWGHEVLLATDGPSGADLIVTRKPDVALVDIGLPELDGYGVAARVRGAPDGHATRLIAMTGFGQDYDRRRASEAGFNAHLVKPATASALKKALSL
jgi:signal transduction histidine kinase